MVKSAQWKEDTNVKVNLQSLIHPNILFTLIVHLWSHCIFDLGITSIICPHNSYIETRWYWHPSRGLLTYIYLPIQGATRALKWTTLCTNCSLISRHSHCPLFDQKQPKTGWRDGLGMNIYRQHFMRVLLIGRVNVKIIVSFCCKYKLLVNPSYKLRQQVLYYSLFKLFRLGIQLHTPDTFPSLVLVQST